MSFFDEASKKFGNPIFNKTETIPSVFASAVPSATAETGKTNELQRHESQATSHSDDIVSKLPQPPPSPIKSPPMRIPSSSSAINRTGDEIRSISSKESIGLENAGYDRSMLGDNRFFDIVQVAILCRAHRTIMFATMAGIGGTPQLYFPFVALRSGESAHSAIVSKMQNLIELLALSNLERSFLSEAVLVDLLHVMLPPSSEYVCRYTVRVEIKRHDGNTCLCGKSVKGYQWEQYDETGQFRSKVEKFWAIEPVLLLEKILTAPDGKHQVLQEVDIEEITKYLSEPVKATDNPICALLSKLGYTTFDVHRIYLDYFNNTFPSLYMNRNALYDWLNNSRLFHFGYILDQLLVAMQIDPDKDATLGYIDFEEFFIGLLFMDLGCPQQSPFADVRISYIFRYYANGKECIEFDEIVAMTKDVESIYYRNIPAPPNAATAKLTPVLAAQLQMQEVEAFWKEAGVGAERGKGIGLNYAKFRSTIEHFSATKSRYFDPDRILRTVKPLLFYQQQINSMQRPTFLGRDFADIYRKREEQVCTRCELKPFARYAEHTVKVFYNGSIIDVIDNEKVNGPIAGGPRRGDKARRRTSNAYFKDDTFANVLLSAICAFAEEGAPSISRCKRWSKNRTIAPAADQSNVPSVKWGPKFAAANFAKIMQLLNDMDDKCDDTIMLQSPVAIFPDYNGKLYNLLLMERNISNLVTVCFPIRYVYMINWSDLAKNGLEFILFFAANKTLLPDSYHLLIGQADSKKLEMMRISIAKQCEAMFGSKENVLSMCAAFQHFLFDKTARIALIDDVITVAPGIEHVGSVIENLDRALGEIGDVEPKKVTAAAAAAGSTVTSPKKQQPPPQSANVNNNINNHNSNNEGKSKIKNKLHRVSSKISAKSVSSTTINVANGVGSISTAASGVSGREFTIFTTNELVTRKVVHIRASDDSTLFQFGKTPQSAAAQQMILLIEGEKIRPIYLFDSAEPAAQ